MLMSNTPLRVIPNPFAAPLAPDGRACALVQVDPAHPSAEQYLGAQLEVGKKVRRGNVYGDKALVRVKRYDLEGGAIDDTEYHRKKVKTGEALAVEGPTAFRCGVPARSPEQLRAFLTSAACARAAEMPDVDIEKAWTEQGLGEFVGPAKKAQERARARRDARIAVANGTAGGEA